MNEMDLPQSVIMPREDFLEMSEAAYNQPPATVGTRAANVAQITLISAAIAAGVTAASWGWAKAVDWREQKQHKRDLATKQFDLDNGLTK